jgi:hypothetical protein
MIRAVSREQLMARKNRKSARAAKRKEGVAIQLMGLGAALLVIPVGADSKLSHWGCGVNLGLVLVD